MNWEDVAPGVIWAYETILEETEGMPPKVAYSTGLRRVGELFNYFEGKYPGGIPNAPSPLAAALTTGLVGSGLGYAAGAIGEKLLPEEWERGKLRRTLALTGGLAGLIPGAIWAGANKYVGLPANSNALLSGPPPINKEARFTKLSENFVSNAGIFGVKPINVNEFNQVIWGDPRVSNRLDPALQAAATGLVEGAAHLSDNDGARFVTPKDVGRLAAGMGSGYLSGAIVGKGLGMLFGMPDKTQDRLKDVGLFAGAIANIVPIAFGR